MYIWRIIAKLISVNVQELSHDFCCRLLMLCQKQNHPFKSLLYYTKYFCSVFYFLCTAFEITVKGALLIKMDALYVISSPPAVEAKSHICE